MSSLKELALAALAPSSLKEIVGDGANVPISPFVPGPNPTATIKYKLTLVPSGGDLNPQLVPLQDLPFPQNHPLEIYVPQDGCEFTIQLDDQWNWEFDSPALLLDTVGTMLATAPANRYYQPDPPLTKSLSFFARFNPGPEGNRDKFNIFVRFRQGNVLCLLKIDPDIKNPGDHG